MNEPELSSKQILQSLTSSVRTVPLVTPENPAPKILPNVAVVLKLVGGVALPSPFAALDGNNRKNPSVLLPISSAP